MISFKWRHFKKDIILMLTRWYLAYSLSYRDIEELALERGLSVDHSTVNRWVIRYSPQLEEVFRKRSKRPVGSSWRMDETYSAPILRRLLEVITEVCWVVFSCRYSFVKLNISIILLSRTIVLLRRLPSQ